MWCSGSLKTALQLLAAIVSCGWILPLWLSADSLLSWFQAEAQQRMDSFPYLAFSRQTLCWACLWLAASLCIWLFLIIRCRCQATPDNRDAKQTCKASQ